MTVRYCNGWRSECDRGPGRWARGKIVKRAVRVGAVRRRVRGFHDIETTTVARSRVPRTNFLFFTVSDNNQRGLIIIITGVRKTIFWISDETDLFYVVTTGPPPPPPWHNYSSNYSGTGTRLVKYFRPPASIEYPPTPLTPLCGDDRPRPCTNIK